MTSVVRVAESAQDARPLPRFECPERLVEQDDLRLADQRGGEGDELPLRPRGAAQRPIEIEHAGDLGPGHGLVDARAALGAPVVEEPCRELERLARRHPAREAASVAGR